MRKSKLNIVLESGRRTFTTERIPVTSSLGRRLIFGKDSNAIMEAVRTIAKDGVDVTKITLESKISDSHLETSKH